MITLSLDGSRFYTGCKPDKSYFAPFLEMTLMRGNFTSDNIETFFRQGPLRALANPSIA